MNTDSKELFLRNIIKSLNDDLWKVSHTNIKHGSINIHTYNGKKRFYINRIKANHIFNKEQINRLWDAINNARCYHFNNKL